MKRGRVMCCSPWGRGISIGSIMSSLADFNAITRPDEPLAPYTWLKVGGPAQFFIEPRHPEELVQVVQCCHAEQIPVRVLGGGSNLLVRDEGVGGVVLRLSGDAFAPMDG